MSEIQLDEKQCDQSATSRRDACERYPRVRLIEDWRQLRLVWICRCRNRFTALGIVDNIVIIAQVIANMRCTSTFVLLRVVAVTMFAFPDAVADEKSMVPDPRDQSRSTTHRYTGYRGLGVL